MIQITQTDQLSDDAIEFVKHQWTIADYQHFGHEIVWKKEKKVLVAKEHDEILGILEYTIQAGVMYIEELIVSSHHQGKGIGKQLMQHAETIAIEQQLHKIYLDTGATWPAVQFYEALGYTKTGELQNHFANADYVIFTKFL